MGRSGYPTKRGNWGGRGSPCKSKSLNFLLLLDKNITNWEILHIYWEKTSNSFKISFNKKFACSMHSVTQLWLIWKSSITAKSLSRIISQNHMPGISLLTKNVTKLLHPPGVDCSPFPWTFMGNPGDGEKSYPTAKNLLISPIRKIPLNRFKSFAVKSFISSPSNSSFQVIILCNLYL